MKISDKNNVQNRGFVALTIVFVVSLGLFLGALGAVEAVIAHNDSIFREEYREYSKRISASCIALKNIHDAGNPWHPFVCEPISSEII